MIGFQPIPSNLIHVNNTQVEAGPIQPSIHEIEQLKSGPRPDTDSTV